MLLSVVTLLLLLNCGRHCFQFFGDHRNQTNALHHSLQWHAGRTFAVSFCRSFAAWPRTSKGSTWPQHALHYRCLLSMRLFELNIVTKQVHTVLTGTATPMRNLTSVNVWRCVPPAALKGQCCWCVAQGDGSTSSDDADNIDLGVKGGKSRHKRKLTFISQGVGITSNGWWFKDQTNKHKPSK